MKFEKSLLSLVFSTGLSTGGTRFSIIAVPWLVLSTTNDAMLMGLAVLVEMLPYVIAKAMSGPLIDRVGAKSVAVWSDLVSTAAVSVIAALVWVDMLGISLLLPLVGLIGALRGPSDAAKQSMIPKVAIIATKPLERVGGLVGAAERLAGALGAAGAGLLVGISGPGAALVANSAAFLLSAMVLLVWMPTDRKAQEPPARIGYIVELMDGVAVLRQDRVLIVLVVMLAFTNLFDTAYAAVLLPIWVKSSGMDASWVGIFLAVFSGSAILGATTAGTAASRLPRLTLYVIGWTFAGPVPLTILASSPPVSVILAVLFFSGAAAGFLGPIMGAMLFERIPMRMMGRVVALVGSLTWALIPFAGLYASILFDVLGNIALSLTLTGGLYFGIAMSPLTVSTFRSTNRRHWVSRG